MANKKRPKVGVGVLVLKDGKVLLGKRKGTHGVGHYGGKHYIDVGVVAEWKSGEPKILEPKKCAGWGYYDLNSLPKPLFAALENYIEAYKSGKNFFDS